jgi:hypothetical protein
MRKIILKESQLKYVLDSMINEQSTPSVTTISTTSGAKSPTPQAGASTSTNPAVVKKKGFDKTIASNLLLPGLTNKIFLKLYPQQYPILEKILNMVGKKPETTTTIKNTGYLQNTPIVFINCSRERKKFYVVNKNTFENDELTNFCQANIDQTWSKNHPTEIVEIPKIYGGPSPELYNVA